MITNINADRVSYHEVPQTQPSTPVSTRSLPLPIQEPHQSRYREISARRWSPARLSENLELVELQRNPKMVERKGER